MSHFFWSSETSQSILAVNQVTTATHITSVLDSMAHHSEIDSATLFVTQLQIKTYVSQITILILIPSPKSEYTNLQHK